MQDNFGMKLLNLPSEWDGETQYDSAYGLLYAQNTAVGASSSAVANDYTVYYSIEITPPEPDPSEPTDYNTNITDPSFSKNPSNYPGYSVDGSEKDAASAKDPAYTGSLFRDLLRVYGLAGRILCGLFHFRQVSCKYRP